MHKNIALKLITLIIPLFFTVGVLGEDPPQTIPIDIHTGNTGTVHPTSTNSGTPIACWYDCTDKAIYFSFTAGTGTAEVSILNITKGQTLCTMVSTSQVQQIAVPGESGVIFMHIIYEGGNYYGEVSI